MSENKKIIVVLGPTASGKSEAAIWLAKKFDGEIISADSRQIYREMNIGTGKVTKKEMRGIKHWMLNTVSPKTNYNVAKFKKAVDKIIPDILSRNKLPIICGGTGFWIKAIVDNVKFPAVKPDNKLRHKLSNYPAERLHKILRKLDPARAQNIGKKDKVRLIRAIEICKALGFVPKNKISEAKYVFLQIGIKIPKNRLHQNIKKRLDARFRQGLVKEIKNLHYKYGVTWKRLESFGLEYKWIALYLQGKMTKREMRERLFKEIKNYAKRQMIWFKKDKRIKWTVNNKNILRLAADFLKKNNPD